MADQANSKVQDYTLRNREHQRLSRARKKEYVTELETRLRRYEEEGARVTAEVQAAAKKVAEENRHLRALLQRHGISTAVSDAHAAGSMPDLGVRSALAGSTKSSQSSSVSPKYDESQNADFDVVLCEGGVESGRLDRSLAEFSTNELPQRSERRTVQRYSAFAPSNIQHVNQASDRQLARPHLDQINPPPPRSSLPRQDQSPQDQRHPHPTSSFIEPDPARDCDLDERSAYPTIFKDGLPIEETQLTSTSEEHLEGRIVKLRGTHLSNDEMACEDAARIIANMRGLNYAEPVWSELGCSSGRNCTVANVKILQLS